MRNVFLLVSVLLVTDRLWHGCQAYCVCRCPKRPQRCRRTFCLSFPGSQRLTVRPSSITLDKQCLVDFSTADHTDPTLAPSFAEIVANPEVYMDKLLTFDAVLKRIHGPHDVELYTNDLDLRFYIHTHGAPLYRLDDEGDQVPLERNETYRFKCRIYELKKHIDHGGWAWEVHSEFLVSTSKKIIHLPELVSE